MLLSLGFKENISRRALLATHNANAEVASNWCVSE